MLQIVSQTNLDTVIFMSDDTPMSQIVGLNLGLLKKKFLIKFIKIQAISLRSFYRKEQNLQKIL